MTTTSQIDRYAIYLRKSRADLQAEKLGEGETLARHKKILTALAARNELFVEEIYQEIVSGDTIEARPEMQRLIHDCYAGKYRGVIVIDISRLSRGNQGDAQIIIDMLTYSNQNNGVLVVTPTKTYDIAHNQDDAEYLEFELFMSRREYKMIRKRMDRGKKQAVVEGNFMASYRPYGYDILKTKTARTLIPNEEEAPIVKKIFEWTVNDNLTPGTIARKLTTMGVPTYSGDPEWSLATVKTILTNPTYMGKVRWNDRMQVKTLVDGKLVKSRPRSNHTNHYMLYEGKHMKYALVDEATFEAASKRFYSDKTKKDCKLKNPLAGLLICPVCGKVMTYNEYPTKPTVQPRYMHTQSQLCEGKVKSALASDVIGAVAHGLQLRIEEFEMLIDNMPDVDENTILDQLEALQKEQRKFEKRLDKLFDAWEDGDISNNEFIERKAVNNQKIEAIKKQMDELEDSIPEIEEYQEKVLMLSDALAALQDEDLDADVKNIYLKSCIECIEFSREENGEFILDIKFKENRAMVAAHDVG